MSELPKGWVTAPIGVLLAQLPSGKDIDQGWSPRCENFPSENEETWGALKTTAIQDGWFEAEHTKQLPEHLNPKPELEVRPGDILLTCAGPRVRCGVVCRVNEVRRKLFISGKMYRFRANETIVQDDFLLGQLRAPKLKLAIDRIKTGGSESGLNLTQSRFKSLNISVPPLGEQKRIVTKLASLSTKSERVRKELTRIDALVPRHKQAVLDRLFEFSGKCKPLCELVDRSRGIPYGIVQTGKPYPNGVPTIRCGDIKNYSVKYSDLKRVKPEVAESYSRTTLVGGEVLLAIRGSIGETCTVPDEFRGVNISREVAMIPVTNQVSPQFVMYFLRSRSATEFIGVNTKGSAQRGINLRDLRNLPVPTLLIEDQMEIVRSIESAFRKVDRLAAQAKRALELTDKLDEAILAKAFRGELVPQDPNDEPASVLLDRVKAERAAAPKAKRGRKKKV